MVRSLVSTGLALLVALHSGAATRDGTKESERPESFQVGQRWAYRTSSESDSTLIVVKADAATDGVLFVDIEGVVLDGEAAKLTFIPLTHAALARSVTKFIGTVQSAGYLETAYDEWKANEVNGARLSFDTDVENVVRVLQGRVVPGSDVSSGGESGDHESAERYNEAVRLSNAGRPGEALEVLDGLLEDCDLGATCERWRETADQLRRVVEHQAFAKRYNEAIKLANEGKRKQAVAILKDLESTTTDESLLARVRDALKRLGA